MNYPIWELTTLGGGTLIAIIAVLHVYISHLAVGGGLFIWLTDWKGYRENNPDIHAYVKKHTWFFLYLTMVFGGLSGVGIWFIIALVSPAGTSSLIHSFVFGWAIEYVFFVGEIVALLVYAYKFDFLNRKERMSLSFLYFLFAWLSLVVINGILSYMLTPGAWLETNYFWHGFFNPTYFSSLFFRSFMSFMIAGLFAYVTIVFLKDSDFRQKMMRYATKWLLYPLIGLIPSAIWYYYSLPVDVRTTAFDLNPQTMPMMMIFYMTTLAIFIIGLILSIRSSIQIQRALTFLLVIIGLLWMGGFEYTREIARKPFVINNYMYSTSVYKKDVEKLNTSGVLASAKWTAVKSINTENEQDAGRELFNLQCLSCHTIDGIRNDILPLTEDYTYLGMISLLHGQGKILNYMPPFMGTEKEKEALAAYLTAGLHQKKIEREPTPFEVYDIEQKIPEFDSKKDDYVLLVWNDLGMHCISDGDKYFVILPPANTLEAQLIKRGETPEIITDGVSLTYQVETGFENPSKHVDFWKYSEKTFGAKLEENVGLFGNGLSGEFDFREERNSFIVEGIPVVPYRDDEKYNPYPLFYVVAKDTETGEILMQTQVVAPASTEMGCRNCHGGGWRTNNVAGIADETAANILRAHDKIEKTDLLEQAEKGNPMLCQSCHADPALAAKGDSTVINFSAAMHGWHANYMPYEDARSCVLCHPASRKGNTRCERGFHSIRGLTCINCHGTMQEHGLALLKAESNKSRAISLMLNLSSVNYTHADINQRQPWLNEPDCLTCHEDFEQPADDASGFNVWNNEFGELYRMRTGDAGVRCQACHGSTHALYPANNPFGKKRDNIQPIQYGGMTYPIGSNYSCAVCHKQKMEDSIHHDNMERMFRNTELIP